MNILFIAHINPFSGIGGDFQRLNLFLRALSSVATRLDVIVFEKGAVSNIDNARIIHSLPSQIWIPNKWKQLFSISPKALFQEDIETSTIVTSAIENHQYDLIATKYIPNAFKYGLFRYKDKLVIDVDDHPTDEFNVFAKQSLTIVSKLRKKVLAYKAKFWVPIILKDVKYSFFSNPRQVIKNGHCSYLPNTPYYDCNDITLSLDNNNYNILFVGDLTYPPNYQGVDRFISRILPKIEEQIPNIQFNVIGKLRDQLLFEKWSSHNGVNILGYIDNILPYYKKSQVVVVPVYYGGGSNIKVLEALSMHRACVATSYSISAFNGIISNKDCRIANNDDEFAEATISLLKDISLNQKIAESGWKTVKLNFSKDAFINTVANCITK